MATPANQSRRPRLSVAMIVRDEQDVLTDTIESVRAVADEIVVVDTGSTDETPAIAEQLGAAVRRMRWTDSFAAARNRCLQEVSGDWILWLDAGEQLTRESADELRAMVDQEADPRKLYLLMVELPPEDVTAWGEQAALPRLMPNHPELRFEGRVRESVKPSAEAAGLTVECCPGRIVRHGRQHDPRRRAKNARRDLKLVALEAADRGHREPRLLIALGEAHTILYEHEEARDAFLQAVRTAERGSTEMLSAYYGLLTTFDNDPDGRDRQLAVCLEALQIYPLDAQLLCAMGSYLQARKRLDLAARAFDTALGHGKVDPQTWHLRQIGEVAAVCLNLTLQLMGKDDEARRVLETALKRHESSARIRRHLIDLHVKQGRGEDAVSLAETLPMEPPQRELMCDAVRGACKAAAGEWLAALGYLQSAYVAGCHDPFCLRWLSITLLSNGQTEAAEPILNEWRQLEPNNVELQAYLEASKELDQASDVAEVGADGKRETQGDQSRQIRIDSVPEVGPGQMPAAHRPLPAKPAPNSGS